MSRIAPVALAVLLAFAAPAFAAGGSDGGGGSSGGSSGSGGGGDASPTAKSCKSGQVWNKKTKKCVKAQSGVLPDEELYQ